jgi:hypothetical protein
MHDCELCDELLDEYVSASSELPGLARELSNAARAGDREDFVALWEEAQLARHRCQSAREALESHRQLHCSIVITAAD